MIQPGNVTYANSTTTASEPLPSTLIDSGTTLNLLPYGKILSLTIIRLSHTQTRAPAIAN